MKAIIATFVILSALAGCKHNQADSDPAPISPAKLVAFDPDGKLDANIRWTTYGVPHIQADNLQSLGFGSGYAYATQNICILADQMVKVRSERARYFGASIDPDKKDNKHLISDLGYKALHFMRAAGELYPSLSEQSRALVEGYVAGYNQYLQEKGVANLPPRCANQPWVTPIKPQELLAYAFSVSQAASGIRFIDAAFFANPGEGKEFQPYSSANVKAAVLEFAPQRLADATLPKVEDHRLGSNAWGIGGDWSENGKGILLANPHFPFSGSSKFWQWHLTIPGAMNVTGASLHGLPGIVNIGFNDNVAWTHTVSKSRRFVVYRLKLADNDREHYVLDGEKKPIRKETHSVEVAVAPGKTVSMSKDFYYSHHGLMVETPPNKPLMPWNDKVAHTLRVAKDFNLDMLDHWLALNLAKNLEEFQAAFKNYDGIPWVNTMYADKAGNAFYIDNSHVLELDDKALAIMRSEPQFIKTRQVARFDILPGDNSLFEPKGLNPYAKSPKLIRKDFVQNSNDSYWATNPAEPLTGYSILYGSDWSLLSFRTRMSLQLLADSKGQDNKFSPQEVEAAWASNRAYLAELVLDELIAQCQKQGSTPVSIDDKHKVDISQGCKVLQNWDRRYNLDSKGGLLFREFASGFDGRKHLAVGFQATQPAITPNTLKDDGSALLVLAKAILNLQSTEFALDAPQAEWQFFEKTNADGNPSGKRYPWSGPTHRSGGFNIFGSANSDTTLYKLHSYPPVKDAISGKPLRSGLTEQGHQVNYGTSWVFVVNFTEDGPQAKGLVTYSQSSDQHSPHRDDQSQYYSENTSLRPILFTEQDIKDNVISEVTVSSK